MASVNEVIMYSIYVITVSCTSNGLAGSLQQPATLHSCSQSHNQSLRLKFPALSEQRSLVPTHRGWCEHRSWIIVLLLAGVILECPVISGRIPCIVAKDYDNIVSPVTALRCDLVRCLAP